MTTNKVAPSSERLPARFYLILLGIAATIFAALHALHNNYAYYSGYVILQYATLAVGWNILGGNAGYVNFGSAAFFAMGAYTTVCLAKAHTNLLLCVIAAGCVGGALGVAAGYLTLRVKGVYFSIATLALSVVLETLVVNWSYVGGSRGVYLVRPNGYGLFSNYSEFLFVLMLGVTALAITLAAAIERSRVGLGLKMIRDDERAAEAAGVPTFRLKLIAAGISGALMGVAGAPMPYYSSYLNAESAFSMGYSINAMAMPIIGGVQSWVGPVVGAVLLASLQQYAVTSISSSANMLIVGGALVIFVSVAPKGLVGLFASLTRRRAR